MVWWKSLKGSGNSSIWHNSNNKQNQFGSKIQGMYNNCYCHWCFAFLYDWSKSNISQLFNFSNIKNTNEPSWSSPCWIKWFGVKVLKVLALKNLLCCCLVQGNKASYYHRILKMCLKMYSILTIEQHHIFCNSAILLTEKDTNEHCQSILENRIWYWSLKGSCDLGIITIWH